MRTLITGGAGFIGSHLAERLLAEGHHVCVLDDLSSGQLSNIDHLHPRAGFSTVIDSITNDDVVADLIDEADVVFHLAAAVGVRMVVSAPLHTVETNVTGTQTVLRHACRGGTLVVLTSTSEVYGKGTALPFREDADLVLGAPTKLRWAYAASKLLDEFLALACAKEQDLPVIIVRLFNTVGPRQSHRYGMVLPTFVRQALEGEALTVHGDGSQTRCFTWVGDVVSALLGLVAEPRAVGQIFNVGNDDEISIRDLALKVRDHVGGDSPVRFEPHEQVFDSTFEDMSRRVPDVRKLRAAIGQAPMVHLDEIIERTMHYWLAQRSLLDADLKDALSSLPTVSAAS